MNNNNSSPRRSARLCRPTTRYDPIERSGRNQRRRRRGNQPPPTEQRDLFNDATINNTIPTRILRRSRRLNPQQQPQQQQQIHTEQTTSHGLPVSPSSLLRNVLEAPSRVTGPAMLADVITQAVVNAYRDRRNNNNNNNNNTNNNNTSTTTIENNNNNTTNENNNNNNSNDLSVSTSTPVPAPAFDPSLLDITPDANSEENSFFRFVRLPLHVPSNDTSEIVMPMFIVGYRTQQEVTSTPPEHLQQPDQEQQTQEQVHILPPQTQLPQEETVVIGGAGEGQEEGRGGNGSGGGRGTLRRSQRIREIRRRQQQREDEERENNNNRRYTVSRWIIYFISGMDNPNYDDLVAAWQAEHRNTGLTIEQIHANAPQQPFSTQIANTLIGGSEQCHVCLEKFELLENVRVLPCQHGFHQECIDKWLMEAQNRCPLCRNAVVPLSSLL
ncbi:hypothetical protein INT45_005317 [Circinella minor]|uniref:RING-type domain-containing protein n=1 Tax=Circinella minor TaxID=1195481 RepID=A0A8H7SA46_9FUNG|nr:hypothetical protein INT45_005317 [Circinella minor]